MGFFPTTPNDGDEIGPNTNGSFFKYVAVDNKWILIPNADVYTEAEVDALIADFVTQANTDALYSVLAHLHDDRYYTETEINANTYTRAQVDTAVATKATTAEAVQAVEDAGLDFATTKALGFVDDEAGVFIDRIYDENDLTSDDEHGLATQQSIKAHVAAEIAGAGAFNPPIGFITMYSGNWTDNTTIPGWYKCDGNNGTVNLVDKFVRGGATSGATGGSDDAVIVSHTHNIRRRAPGIQSGTLADSGLNLYLGYVSGYISSTGVSGVGANKPAYYTLIFIQRIS